MAHTKQTAHTEKGDEKKDRPDRAAFESTSANVEEGNVVMTVQESRGDTEDSQQWLDEGQDQGAQRIETGIVLPRAVSVNGMHPTFVQYFCEHGATPILQKNLLERRGFTHDMIVQMVRNCNKAWGLKKLIPSEYRYMDELDTDEELGLLPRTGEVGRKRPRGQEEEDLNNDEWDLDASMDTVSKGQKPSKKARKDICPTKQLYHGSKKGKGKKEAETGIVSKTVEE